MSELKFNIHPISSILEIFKCWDNEFNAIELLKNTLLEPHQARSLPPPQYLAWASAGMERYVMLVLIEIHNEGQPPDRDRFALVELHLCNPVHYVQFVKYIFPRNRTTSN